MPTSDINAPAETSARDSKGSVCIFKSASVLIY